jgi:glycosyltransferase involved in cell wall biosynthesis
LAAGIGKPEQYRVFFPGLPAPHVAGKSELRKELELDPATIYCTFVGRLTQIKRPDRLLDIAEAVAKENVSIHFLVAGEGELFESSRARATAQKLPMTFLGWRKDIDQLFAASDIAILTSDNEGIPLTLIQAAQAGLPIVATEVGSISDSVEDSKTGFLTKPEPAAMALKVIALATNTQLRKELGSAGKERANNHFSLERMLRDHTEIYHAQHKK